MLGGGVQSIAVYKEKIYTYLSIGFPEPRNAVFAFDMDGEFVVEWTHNTAVDCWSSNALCIASNQVVLPDQPAKRLTVYSLNGKVKKHIPCSAIGNERTAMCMVGNAAVVIADFELSQVSRMNIATGEILWTWRDSCKPSGVLSFGRRFILLATYKFMSSNVNALKILDSKTGKILNDEYHL